MTKIERYINTSEIKKNLAKPLFIGICEVQGLKGSNPRPTVLETCCRSLANVLFIGVYKTLYLFKCNVLQRCSQKGETMKKIPTLYKRIFNGHEKVGITNEISDELRGIDLSKLRATVKWDGSCCAVIDGKFYKRYDAKHGKPIPPDAIKCQEEADPITGHLPCWVPVTADNCDRWFVAALAYEGKRLPLLEDGTYEAIGKHFNGNKYNLDYDMLVPHGRDVITKMVPTFEGIKEYLSEHNIEGIVFWNKHRPVCKIKRSDFGLEW